MLNLTLKKLLKSALLTFMLSPIILAKGQTTSYSNLYDSSTFSKTIDVSLPVGTIEGKHGMSPAGGSTYSIPLKMPPGSNGLAPTLSIDYNSQGGNGAAGYGWNVSGISMIEQTYATIAQDGKVAPIFEQINFPNPAPKSDRLILDGERLKRTSPEPMALPTLNFSNSRGILVKAVGNYPQDYHYEYTDKDGTKYEYGLDENSRLFLSDKSDILKWNISRITDVNGFYIEYKYSKNNGEILIDEINYTGNSNTGILPYNKIKFRYKERDDKNVSYVSGTAIATKNILDRIDVTAENNMAVYSYQLNYARDAKIINNKYSFLKEVVLYGSDGTHLNSTIFKYGDSGTEFQTTPTSVVVNGEERIAGDYDGDGISDIAFIKTNGNLSGTIVYNIYKGNATGQNMQLMGSVTLNSTTMSAQSAMFGLVKYQLPLNITSHFSSDFDGDGHDDILTGSFEKVGSDLYLRKLVLIKNIGGTFITQNISLPQTPDHEYKVTDFKNPITIADFDGDKWPDVLITAFDNRDVANKGMIAYDIGRTSTPNFVNITNRTTTNTLVPEFINPDYWAIIDHDGDGKNEILTISGAETKIWSMNHTYRTFDVIYKAGYPTVWHDVYTGDFNGDGKTDLLTKVKSSSLWEIAYSNGFADYDKQPFNGTGALIGDYYDHDRAFNRSNGPIPDRFYVADQILIGDFNGDGKADMIHAVPYTEGGSVNDKTTHRQRLNAYFSNGYNSFNNKVYVYSSWLSTCTGCVLPNDLNGDGRADIFTGFETQRPFSNVGEYAYLIKFNEDGKEKVLHKVINGYNIETEFTYNYLNKSPNYIRNGTGLDISNPYITFPLLTLTSTQVKSKEGTPILMENTSYRYEDGAFNKRGLGFLGFRKTITTDNIQDKKTEQEMSFTIVPDNLPGVTAILPRVSSTKIFTGSGQLLSATTSKVNITAGQVTAIVKKEETITDALAGTISTNNTVFDDRMNIIQTVANANNIVTTNTDYTYNTFGNASKPVRVSTKTTRTGMPTVSDYTTLSYNGIGKLLEKIESADLPNAVRHQYFYNNMGLLATEMTTAPGVSARLNRFEYDNAGRFIIKKTNPLNVSEFFKYDPRSGAVISHTGYDMNTTTYEHDAYFNLIKTTYPKGNALRSSRSWQLDGKNMIRTITSPEGGVIEIADIDAAGRVTAAYKCFQTMPINILGQTILFPAFTQANITYDAKGNKIQEQEPHYGNSGNYLVNNFTYDYLNRMTSSCNQLGCTQYNYSFSNGNSIVSTTLPSGQIEEKTTDATGAIIATKDNGGNVFMTYDSWGHNTATRLGSAGAAPIMQSKYDEYNRKTETTERNAGTFNYSYDAYGQMAEQKDANGNIHKYVHDLLGRITARSGAEGTTSYYYKNAASQGEGFQLEKVVDFNNDVTAFEFSQYGEKTGIHQSISGKMYDYEYDYDQFGNQTSSTGPDGFQIRNIYNNYGVWTEVRTEDKLLYRINSINAAGKTLAADRGNGMATNYTYDYQFLKRIQSPVMDYNLDYDYTTGNITRRVDLLKPYEELFTYDASNRLTSATTHLIQGMPLPPGNITYNNLTGNITHRDGIGDYSYGTSGKPNAVSYITNTSNQIPTQTQDIKYNSFLRADEVKEGDWDQRFTYGADYQRVVSELYQNGSLEETRIYAPEGFEIHSAGGKDKTIHYVPGPDGVCAILYSEGNKEILFREVKTYYPYSDHLGSILALTDENGNVQYEQNFDAWGRGRDPYTWSYSLAANTGFEWLRGFTGHEHMPQFNLINMNARLYDPIIGRMLSPDNCLANAYSTQAYNRYSYANNNPLSYVDPDGNNPLVVAVAVGAIISASSYTLSIATSTGGFNNWNWLNFAGSVVTGAVSGAFTWGIGNAFSPVANVSVNAAPTSSFANEAARGLMHGYLGLVTTGELSSFAAGALGSYASSIGNAYAPGTLGSFGDGLVFSGVTAGVGSLATGGKFWQGALIGIEGYLLNQSMHRVKLKPGAIINNHDEDGGSMTVDRLFAQYMTGGGVDYTPYDARAKDMIDYFYEKGMVDESKIKPVDGVPGLFYQGVSTYGGSFQYSYAVGEINVYFIEGGVANTKYIPVGFSDYYNFDSHSDRVRPGFAETATTIGRNLPGKYYNIRYGLTPTQRYINKNYKK